MQLLDLMRRLLLRWAERRMRRAPDRVIGVDYMRRWHAVPRNRFVNVYLHEFSGSDDDRALHDHPWMSCSVILRGWYLEHLPANAANPAGETRAHFRDTGSVTVRRASAAHRIEISRAPVVTLFITGPRRREWGFWCAKGWRHWRVFTDPKDRGQVGRGCE